MTNVFQLKGTVYQDTCIQYTKSGIKFCNLYLTQKNSKDKIHNFKISFWYDKADDIPQYKVGTTLRVTGSLVDTTKAQHPEFMNAGLTGASIIVSSDMEAPQTTQSSTPTLEKNIDEDIPF
jgi:primosomal replication protein N